MHGVLLDYWDRSRIHCHIASPKPTTQLSIMWCMTSAITVTYRRRTPQNSVTCWHLTLDGYTCCPYKKTVYWFGLRTSAAAAGSPVDIPLSTSNGHCCKLKQQRNDSASLHWTKCYSYTKHYIRANSQTISLVTVVSLRNNRRESQRHTQTHTWVRLSKLALFWNVRNRKALLRCRTTVMCAIHTINRTTPAAMVTAQHQCLVCRTTCQQIFCSHRGCPWIIDGMEAHDGRWQVPVTDPANCHHHEHGSADKLPFSISKQILHKHDDMMISRKQNWRTRRGRGICTKIIHYHS